MKKSLLFLLPLIVGIGGALALWNHIWLPFSNPLHIISAVTEASFNPTNNSLRFAVLLLAPLGVLYILYKVKPSYFAVIQSDTQDETTEPVDKSTKRTSIVIVSILSIFCGIISPTFIASGEFDPFHEGESLAPAVSYQAGQVPYNDMVFIHGVYQDPLRSVVAFSLFGRSIGAVRTWESIMKLMTWLLLGIFILQLFRWRLEYSVIALIILGVFSSIGGMILLPRDFLTLLLLNTFGVISHSIHHSQFSRKSVSGTAVLLGLIPTLGLGFSIDRGVYYVVIVVVILPFLCYYFYRKTNSARLFIRSAILGSLAGILLLGMMLRWNYMGFLTFCFVQVPQYKELMDSYIFPVFNYRFSMSLLLATTIVYYYGWKILKEFTLKIPSALRHFFKHNLDVIVLALLGLLLMRNVLGRADMQHVKYSWFALILSAIYITFQLFILPIIRKYPGKIIHTISISICIIFVGFSSYRIVSFHLIGENFPLQRTDDYYIPTHDKATIDYLKNTIQLDEEFLTLTGEGAWYYYLNKPCPVRFNIIQFAMYPEFQREVLRDLQHKNIKYILYSNSHWANRIDGFTNNQRLPEVMKYIHENYHLFKTIDHNQLWIRNNMVASK
ncbi:MAG: hypothetical protein IPM69_00770 [Ignavibacteria bacterium]|nr:hypothetical protein [Ignavibacteria bacterium]